MKKPSLFKKSVIATVVALASQQAMAAGFQLNSQSATGLGRAFAGDAVIADNASVMAKNAAAMALFDETALSLGVVSIKTLIKVKDAEYTNATGTTTSSADYDSAGSTSYAPNLHLIVPLNEKFAVGINAYTNFGTKTEFNDSYVAGEFGGTTDIKSINFGLAGSYRIDEQWSLGAGLDIIYGQGKMQRATASGAKLLDIDADGWGVGFNLGTVYEMDDNNRFGLAYHYSPELKVKGDVYRSGVTYDDDTLTLPLPDIWELSGYHRLEDSKFAVHYSVQWIGWNTFDTLKAKDAGTIKTYEWQNGMHYSIGTTYYLNNDWTLRAGYMYDTSAQDEITSISVPDSDRNWFSAGFTYNLTAKSNIDFGFTYLLGEDVDVTESQDFSAAYGAAAGTYVSHLNATTHADAILIGLQYSQTF
ncbi:aromatic hydrocarbon degradation protein [Vibrio sp. HA2012]|uniref:outer membrane protein transport protein n=1 Tax=Vibrio sp. HA2012 TaxID=1971595 RepID=UPI000C2BC6F2|nr:outer membrane protein transport protein [Vibrio sp. HA2012]PJC85427.1 aromatic hydrocarbon degradation protein [Vibrio sp. HA2012]